MSVGSGARGSSSSSRGGPASAGVGTVSGARSGSTGASAVNTATASSASAAGGAPSDDYSSDEGGEDELSGAADDSVMTLADFERFLLLRNHVRLSKENSDHNVVGQLRIFCESIFSA